MRILSAVLISTVLCLRHADAADADFNISIVGNQQSSVYQGLEVGRPMVFCPAANAKDPHAYIDDKINDCFFVIIQNATSEPSKITMWSSDWYECLRFNITDKNGKIDDVHRWPTAWTVNGQETRIIPADGFYVVAVDLTNLSRFGGWEGQPKGFSKPEAAGITATFCYRDSVKKLISISSPSTDIYLSSRN